MVALSTKPVTAREDKIRFHDFRSHVECRYCGGAVNWMFTKFGTKLPFDAELLSRLFDRERTGWIPGIWKVKGRDRMVMGPVTHYSAAKVARVTHVAIVHTCPQYHTAQSLGLLGETS